MAESKEFVLKPKKKKVPLSESFVSGAAERVAGNVLGIPEAVARAGLGAKNIPNLIMGRPLERVTPGDSILGLPDGRQALSGAQAIGGLLKGEFNMEDTFNEALQERQEIESANPNMFSFGEFGGDALSLILSRSPRSGPGGILDDAAEQLRGSVSSLIKPVGKTGMAKQTKEIVDSQAFKDLARAAGRSVETGLEGAALAMVQDGDPVETFALAAGGQLASSGALKFADGMITMPLRLFGKSQLGPIEKKLVGVGVQGAILGTLFKLFQQNPDVAEETAFDKLTYGILIGAALGLPGKRPKADGLLENFPTLADAILTVPRAGMIKAAQSMAEDENSRLVAAAMTQPERFSQKHVEQFQKAVESGNLPEAAREIVGDEDFQRALKDEFSFKLERSE